MLPSFPRSARVESSIESGMLTNILHFNSYNGKKWKYVRIKVRNHVLLV